MTKISHKLNKIIIIILNSIYLTATLMELLIVCEYVVDIYSSIYSDFSRFKIMHSPIEILNDIIMISLWVIFSIFVYKYNKKSISKNRSIIAYSVIPFAVLLILYLSLNLLNL